MFSKTASNRAIEYSAISIGYSRKTRLDISAFFKEPTLSKHSYPRETCAVMYRITLRICRSASSATRKRRGPPYPVNGVRWILLFSDFRLRRPTTKDAGAASASLCGGRGARHRGVIRHRHEGVWRGRERLRRKRNWKHPRGRFATLLIRAAFRPFPFSLRAVRRNASATSPFFLASICSLA